MAAKLSKHSIVDAALDLLDEEGLDGVRLRAIAAKLGVQAPAIYWHFRDKQDLLDEMATEVWRAVGVELAALPTGQPWEADVRSFAHVERRALLRYRDGAKAFSGTYLTDPRILEQQEESLARWIAHGFALQDVIRTFALVHSFTVGFCIEEQAVAQVAETGDERYSLEARSARLDADAVPLVVASGAAIFGEADARFDGLLDLIVEAVGRLRA